MNSNEYSLRTGSNLIGKRGSKVSRLRKPQEHLILVTEGNMLLLCLARTRRAAQARFRLAVTRSAFELSPRTVPGALTKPSATSRARASRVRFAGLPKP